jgi:ubiquinone/menaquinone biosynthesis C-methylase UbiE
MADIYAHITTVAPGVQEQIATILDLRAADPQQRAMRRAYWSEIGFPENARVLEVGCGPGPVTRALAEWPNVGEVVGLDPSSIFLSRARRLTASIHNVSFVEGDARELPFEDSRFDVVILHTTLCHVPEPERALSEARRVLRDEGWLAIFDGDYATTTVATGAADPLQSCADAWVASSVHDPWLMRRAPEMARAAGFAEGRVRSHGYVEAPSGGYMLTIVERGIAALLAQGRIGDEAADALRSEARRRSDTSRFFGHIAYASLVVRAAPAGDPP